MPGSGSQLSAAGSPQGFSEISLAQVGRPAPKAGVVSRMEEKMMKDAYRNVARWYDRIFEPMDRGLRLIGLRMSRPKKGMTILDVGCGTGTHLELYTRYECRLFGIDCSPSMLGIARKRLGDKADLHLGDASMMPYEDRSFDLVISMLVLHEMNQATRTIVLPEMKRVLKDGGRMLLIDYHPGPIRSLRGWRTKLVIVASEVAGGREHFRNYRNYMAVGGLPALVGEHGLIVERHRVVSEGALGLLLLRAE